MPTKTAKNVSDSPVVVDDDGHILGGGESGPVDDSTDRVTALLESGQLVIHQPKAKAPKGVEAKHEEVA